MGDVSLGVHPTDLARSAVSMKTVAGLLDAVKDVIEHHTHLPMFAFGGIGGYARARYNDLSDEAGRQAGDLRAHAD